MSFLYSRDSYPQDFAVNNHSNYAVSSDKITLNGIA